MRERIKTLVLDANGVSWKAVVADTTIRGLLRRRARAVAPRNGFLKKLLGERYESMSYGLDWRDALCESPDLDVRLCNMTNLVDYYRSRRAIREYPLVVVLHTAAGDHMTWLLKTAEWFKRRRGRLAVFVGNEYDIMDEKVSFLKSVEADYICTQLPLDAARYVYAACERSRIIPMPHALNPSLYNPEPAIRRSIEVGFIGDLYDRIIGDLERTNFVRYLKAHHAELEVSFDSRRKRLPRDAWAKYLQSSKAIIGAESGTYYLDREGRGVAAAKAYVQTHPGASFEEVFENSFKNLGDYVSGKAISSRHFEPIGTRTCQILLEGDYNGILKADEHYISVKKDLSNIRDAFERFKDESYREAMARRTHEYVLDRHTYAHRVRTLVETVKN